MGRLEMKCPLMSPRARSRSGSDPKRTKPYPFDLDVKGSVMTCRAVSKACGQRKLQMIRRQTPGSGVAAHLCAADGGKVLAEVLLQDVVCHVRRQIANEYRVIRSCKSEGRGGLQQQTTQCL